MTLQNKDGQNKIFIDDSLTNTGAFKVLKPNKDGRIELFLDINSFTVRIDDIMKLHGIGYFYYSTNDDAITFYSCGDKNCTLKIKEDEIVSLSLINHSTIIINIMKLPKFLFENDMYETYPKFEINISDCVYSIRIYIDESEYIDVPDFQSHNDINDTLKYLSDLVLYLTEGRPDFIDNLCNHENMDVIIHDINIHEKIKASGIMNYKLGERGLYLTGGELEDYLVEWNNFFKLVMDGTWEVDFYKSESEKDCNTCANYTEPDEVDNGCYMCCKGLENNYVPIENE